MSQHLSDVSGIASEAIFGAAEDYYDLPAQTRPSLPTLQDLLDCAS